MYSKIKNFLEEHCTLVFLIIAVLFIKIAINIPTTQHYTYEYNYSTDVQDTEVEYVYLEDELYEKVYSYILTKYLSNCEYVHVTKVENKLFYEIINQDCMIYSQQYDETIEKSLIGLNLSISKSWVNKGFTNFSIEVALLDPIDKEVYLLSSLDGVINFSKYKRLLNV